MKRLCYHHKEKTLPLSFPLTFYQNGRPGIYMEALKHEKDSQAFCSSAERSGSEKEQKAKARADCAAFLRLIRQWDLIPRGLS